jgi:hypothetical protein
MQFSLYDWRRRPMNYYVPEPLDLASDVAMGASAIASTLLR